MAVKDRRPVGKQSRSRFEYQERNEDDVRKRADQKGGQFDSIFCSGVDRWRPKDGENVIRILPPTWEDHDHYGFDIWVHGFVGPDKSTYLCPQKMGKGDCPICAAAREAKRAGEEDEAKQLQATRRVAVWVIDRNDEKPTPSLFDMSWSMDRDIAALCHNKRSGKVLLIDHPDQGYDILFSRTGKGLNTRYIGMAVDREDSPIMSDEEEQEQVLEYIQENPIPDQLNFYDADYLARVIEGGAGEADSDLDEEETETRGAKRDRDRGGKPPRKPSRRDEPEEDAADDADEVAEEEERPRRGDRDSGRSRDRDRPARKPSRRDEEEPADEVVEEDAEEPAEVEERPRKPGKFSSSRKPSRRDEPEDDVEDAADEPDDYDDEPADDEPADDDPPRKPVKSAARKPSRR